MENKPIAFFFNGSNISKIEDGTIKNVDKYYISTNNVYLMKEPVRLLAGVKDETGDLDLDKGDMFLTISCYGKNGWEYYRFEIHSEELKQFIVELEKRNNKEDVENSKPSIYGDCAENGVPLN